jgi:hypothetical protein
MTPDMERLHVIYPITNEELATIKELALTEMTRAIEDSVVRVMADMEKFCGAVAPKGFVKELAITVLKAQVKRVRKL